MLGFHKHFPVDALRPSSGELAGTISSSSIARTLPALTHAIDIALAPFPLADKTAHARLRIASLDLEVRSWRALAGRTYRFPTEGPVRQVDGAPIAQGPRATIELSGQHLPARATALAFATPVHGAIATELHVTLDLARIGYRPADVVLHVALALGGVHVRGDVAMLAQPSPAEAEALARAVLDVADYAPVARDGAITYVPVGVH